MSPYHRGYIRELNTTTALRISAAWLASENTRAARIAALKRRFVMIDDRDVEFFRSEGLERAQDGSLQEQNQRSHHPVRR